MIGRNIAANLGGTAWVTIMSLVGIPLYVRYMGIEAYGLVGFFATLQSTLQLFDIGLSPTLNREMARQKAISGGGFDAARDLVRTLEGSYWALGILLGAGIAVLAPVVAFHWVHPEHLDPRTVVRAIALMGAVAALQWPVSFYSGGLQGLQQQPLLNAITAATATLRFAGSLAVLAFIAPTITAFFVWQAIVSGLYSIALAIAFWTQIPGSHRPQFHMRPLRGIAQFAIGMSGIGVTVVVLSQVDKLIVSRMVTLAQFGYYMLGWVVASGLAMFIAPFFNAVFPHLTALVTRGDISRVVNLYHRATQLVAIVVLPIAVTIIFFAPEVLLVWTGDPNVAIESGLVVRLLVAGTALNAVMNVPYALQLAYGWTNLPLMVNLVSIAVCVPLAILMASRYGVAGAASVWTLLNFAYCAIQLPLIHRRLLRGEQRRWYLRDVGLPAVVAIAVAGIGRLLVPPAGRLETFGFLAAVYIAVAIAVPVVVAAIDGDGTLNIRSLLRQLDADSSVPTEAS